MSASQYKSIEAEPNKAMTGNMRGEDDELLLKDSTSTKDIITTVNMTKIPDCSLIDQLYFKYGDNRPMLK
jgi:hypothetical protein